jgi:hypothetical protein
MEPNRCMGYKTNGERCTRNTQPLALNVRAPPAHLHFCRQHQVIYNRRYVFNTNTDHTAGRCLVTRSNGAWCPHAAGETGVCTGHIQLQQTRAIRAAQRNEREQRRATVLADLRNRQVPWRQAIRELYGPGAQAAGYTVLNRHYIGIMLYRDQRIPGEPGGAAFLWDYIDWVRNGQGGPEPRAEDYRPVAVAAPAPAPAPQTLAAITRDSQNVHRAVVSQQTNRNADLILATPNVNPNIRAHEQLAALWLFLGVTTWERVRRVVDDVTAWRATETCRTHGDWYYRRLLSALYTRIIAISNPDTRKELWRRFYEECEESVGLCCEGHISRLCNVLVGFEDDFAPPIPFGEILQNKMAAIASMEAPFEDKVKLAMAFFDEHKVPAAERSAWIDAF